MEKYGIGLFLTLISHCCSKGERKIKGAFSGFSECWRLSKGFEKPTTKISTGVSPYGKL